MTEPGWIFRRTAIPFGICGWTDLERTGPDLRLFARYYFRSLTPRRLAMRVL